MNRGMFLTACQRVFILAAIVLVEGCGNERSSAPVAGKVTLNGQPQEGIFVYFSPVTGANKEDLLNAGPAAFGKTDAEGRYALQFMDTEDAGALIGDNNVRLDDERTFDDPKVKSRVPRDWKVMFTVPSQGTADANFELAKVNKK